MRRWGAQKAAGARALRNSRVYSALGARIPHVLLGLQPLGSPRGQNPEYFTREARFLRFLRGLQSLGRQRTAAKPMAAAVSGFEVRRGAPRKPQGSQPYAISESRTPSGPESYVFYKVCSLEENPRGQTPTYFTSPEGPGARILRSLRGLQPLEPFRGQNPMYFTS